MADTVWNEATATDKATYANNTGSTSSGATTATDTTTSNSTTTTTQTVPSNAERIQKITDMYDASLNANKANLEAQYQQSLSNAQADKDAIATSYEGQRNNLAAEYERQRRNNDMTAQVNGLNTGAGSQMDLAQTSTYQSNKTALAKAQAEEEATADRNLSDLTTQYQIAVNEAIANNDYQKSAALLDEYNQQKADMQTQAETLAQYGDFTGYSQLGYSDDQVNSMSFAWLASNNASNGDLAYLSGALDKAYTNGTITAEQYKNIHGSYPAGYVDPNATASSGSSGYWSNFYDGSSANYKGTDYYNDLRTGLLNGTGDASDIGNAVRAGSITVDQGASLYGMI